MAETNSTSADPAAENDVIAMSELIDQWWETEEQRTVHYDGVELIASLSLARFLLDAQQPASPDEKSGVRTYLDGLEATNPSPGVQAVIERLRDEMGPNTSPTEEQR